MSDISLNAIFGPRYEIVIANDQSEPLRINVGTGFNNAEGSNSGTLDVTITAVETINAYRAVGYDGLMTQMDADSLSNYAGVTPMAIPIGDPVNVIRSGLMTESGWTWMPNAPIFISANGVLTQTVPSAGNPIRRIGWAISTTQINLDPYPIIGV